MRHGVGGATGIGRGVCVVPGRVHVSTGEGACGGGFDAASRERDTRVEIDTLGRAQSEGACRHVSALSAADTGAHSARLQTGGVTSKVRGWTRNGLEPRHLLRLLAWQPRRPLRRPGRPPWPRGAGWLQTQKYKEGCNEANGGVNGIVVRKEGGRGGDRCEWV